MATTTPFTIEKIEHRTSLIGREGLLASVEMPTADLSLRLSRMEGEKDWYIDAKLRSSNGFPIEVHGYGARGCMKQLATGPLRSALNEAAEELEARS